MQYKHKRKLARFRSEYRRTIATIWNRTDASRAFLAVALLVAVWFLFLFISARPAENPADQAGALLFHQ